MRFSQPITPQRTSRSFAGPARSRWITFLAIGFALLLAGCPERDLAEGDPETINDDWIVTEIKGGVLADPEVHQIDLAVEADGGVVELRGDVQTEAQRQRIEGIARSVEGVQEVENHLEVRD